MMELVDITGLEPVAFQRVGSTPTTDTIIIKTNKIIMIGDLIYEEQCIGY